jgi:hypothetical protein
MPPCAKVLQEISRNLWGKAPGLNSNGKDYSTLAKDAGYLPHC